MKRNRRGKRGEVHLYQPAGAAVWWIRYTHAGKLARKSTGTTDKGEAELFRGNVARMLGMATSDDLEERRRLLDILREIIKELPELESEATLLGNGRNIPTARHWFTKAIDAMKSNTSGDDRAVKATSIARIAQVHKDWLRYLESRSVNLADAPLNRIGADEVRGFLAQLKEEGFSGTSRRFALARIRAVFGRSVDRGFLPVNPASVKQVGRLRFEANSIRRGFNAAQIGAILAACEKSPVKWLRLSAMLGLFTGQRAGDVCAMRWEHIRDLDGPLPLIDVTQQKTGSIVSLPIAEPLRAELLRVPAERRTGYLLSETTAAAYGDGRKRMFQAPWRALLDSLPLADLMDGQPVVAKIKGIGKRGRSRSAWSYHSWRHTTASYLSGADAHHVLGHRSEEEKRLGMTAQYRHEDLRRLKKQLDTIHCTTPTNVVRLTKAAS
ncbi:tyrosine-type recombinase/integrase [bacterium]|nr:tyrosine-type recombinase/integrase [bacterium]